MEQVLQGCMSPDNKIRQQAENTLNKQLEANTPAVATGLMQMVQTCQNAMIRNLAIVLFRKKILKNASLATGFPPEFYKGLQSTLQKQLQAESDDKNVRGLADLIVELAKMGIWAELLPFCIQLFRTDEKKQRSILYLLGELISEMSQEMDQATITGLIEIAGQGFGSKNLPVKIQALKCFGTALVNVKNVNNYCSVVPQIATTLTELLGVQDFTNANKVLNVLVDVASDRPGFYQQHLMDFAGLMKNICDAKQMDGDSRRLALEALVCIIEKEPTMVRKNNKFIEAVLDMSLQLMMEIEDDRDDWNQNYSHNIGEDECFDAGQIALNRVAANINKNKFAPLIYPKLIMCLKQADWRAKHTAVIAVAQVCELMLEGNITKDGLFEIVAPHIQDQHPKVRYAVVHCAAIMCTDFGKKFTNKWNKTLLDIFMVAMADHQNPRMQAHAAICISNWAEKVSSKLLKPYLEDLLKRLFDILNQPNAPRFVQENALSAISDVADNCKGLFKKYYEFFMKPLIHILSNAKGSEYLELRMEAFRAVSKIGAAVGATMFRNEGLSAMRMSLPIVLEDGVEATRIMNSWKRIFQTLQSETAEFLPAVSSISLKYITQEVKLANWNSSDEEADDVEINSRDIAVNIDRVEEQIAAIHLVYSMAKYSDGQFSPMVGKFAQAIFTLLAKPMDDSVQEATAESLPGLLICLFTALKNNKGDANATKELFLMILQKVSEQMRKETSPDCLCSFAICIEKCLKVDSNLAMQCCNDAANHAVTETLLSCLQKSAERMAKRTKEIETADEEDIETLKEENEQEARLSTHIADAVGSYIKVYKEKFLPYLAKYNNIISAMLGSGGLDIQKRAALYIFCDVIEQCSPESYKGMLEFLRTNFMSACTSSDQHVRQAGVYAVGLLVEKCGQASGINLTEVIQVCMQQFTNNKFTSGDVEDVQDNAAMTIGRICKSCPNAVPLNKIYPEWLKLFPIRNDDDCSQWCYAEFLRLIATNNQHFLNAAPDVLPKVAAILGDAMYTDMSTDKIDQEFVALLKQAHGSPMGTKMMNGIPPEIQAKIKAES